VSLRAGLRGEEAGAATKKPYRPKRIEINRYFTKGETRQNTLVTLMKKVLPCSDL